MYRYEDLIFSSNFYAKKKICKLCAKYLEGGAGGKALLQGALGPSVISHQNFAVGGSFFIYSLAFVQESLNLVLRNMKNKLNFRTFLVSNKHMIFKREIKR